MTVITLDLETTGLDWTKDRIILCGYRINAQGEVIYAPSTVVCPILDGYLSNPDTVLRGHNIKFDALFLVRLGYNLLCRLEDTRVIAYSCWPTLESHGLKELVRLKLGKEPTQLGDMLFKPLKKERVYLTDIEDEHYYQIDGEYVRKDLLIQYHKEDILNVDRIRKLMYPSKWFYDVEMPLTKVLFEMELYGCPLDISYLNLLKYELESSTSQLLTQLKQGREGFNPNSSIQVAEVLQQQGVSLEKECEKTDKGAYKVDKQFLKKLVWKGTEGSAFARSLLEYRRLTKILGTYVLPFIEGGVGDGRLHGSINQAGSEDLYGDSKRGANTGRLTSQNPNLQNIPARTKEGKKVRRAFIATPGFTMFDTDLKQIEPRLIGHFSQSPKLINAYAQKKDTHGMFASDIFSKTVEELTETERFIGKTSWLASTYQCSYRKLLYICESFSETPLVLDLKKYEGEFDRLVSEHKKGGYCFGFCKSCLLAEHGTEEEARLVYSKLMFFKDVQDNFWKKNPEIKGWCEEAVARAKRNEYVETLHGNRFPLPDINSSNRKLRAMAERKAINTPIQASSAEIIKLITVRFDREIMRPNLGHLFAIVHDELVGDMKGDLLHKIKDIMCNTVLLRNIAVDADTKIVENWSQK